MTQHKQFIETGARLVLPSGQTASFVRWQVRLIKRGDANQERERVAVVRLDGLGEDTQFSERFMTRVQICRQ